MNTKEKIEVMQAYLDGKKIEYCPSYGVWTEFSNANDPVWEWGNTQYRIKPEPREWWIVFDAAGNFFDFSALAPIAPGLKVVKVREVIE